MHEKQGLFDAIVRTRPLKKEEDGDRNAGMELLKIFGLDKRAHELAQQSAVRFAAAAGDRAGAGDETESAAAG